jgi:hypothetical protein
MQPTDALSERNNIWKMSDCDKESGSEKLEHKDHTQDHQCSSQQQHCILKSWKTEV